MKKILIVSDNPRLTDFFKNECAAQNLQEAASFSYRYSGINKNPAEMRGLGATAIDMKDVNDIAYVKSQFDMVFSLHCKQIFPDDLVRAITCINVHPGLNPHNRGWYPQVFSIINGKPVGATIHIMDEDVDHGAILAQSEVNISSSDTSFDVYEKVFVEEKNLLRKNLLSIIKGEKNSTSALSDGNFNSLKDFKNLCELDLTSVDSLGAHINLLRALSHSEFKNAYFKNEEGEKVYIRVVLEKADS